jgi:hypothetical protein
LVSRGCIAFCIESVGILYTCDLSQSNPADLHQFTGTEHWYRHALVKSVLFTDGAKYLADTAAAYWLLDEIALA